MDIKLEAPIYLIAYIWPTLMARLLRTLVFFDYQLTAGLQTSPASSASWLRELRPLSLSSTCPFLPELFSQFSVSARFIPPY